MLSYIERRRSRKKVMPNKKTTVGRPKDPERRTRILAAAKDTFLQKGYNAASMEAIARAAGVSKVTVYGHFGSLDALLEAVVETEANAINAALHVRTLEDAGVRDRLIALGVHLMKMLKSQDCLRLEHLVTARVSQQPALAQTFYRSGPERTIRNIESIVRQSLGTSASEAAEMLFSLWSGGEQHRVSLGLRNPMSADEAELHVTRCVDQMIRAFGIQNY